VFWVEPVGWKGVTCGGVAWRGVAWRGWRRLCGVQWGGAGEVALRGWGGKARVACGGERSGGIRCVRSGRALSAEVGCRRVVWQH